MGRCALESITPPKDKDKNEVINLLKDSILKNGRINSIPIILKETGYTDTMPQYEIIKGNNIYHAMMMACAEDELMAEDILAYVVKGPDDLKKTIHNWELSLKALAAEDQISTALSALDKELSRIKKENERLKKENEQLRAWPQATELGEESPIAEIKAKAAQKRIWAKAMRERAANIRRQARSLA